MGQRGVEGGRGQLLIIVAICLGMFVLLHVVYEACTAM